MSASGTTGFVVVLAVLVVGFGVATIGWVDYAVSTDTVENAQPVDVRVLETDLSERRTDDGREYSVSIRYEYEIDGETYQSSNVYPGISDRRFSSFARADGLVTRYQEGETATGYVDPDNPERVYLQERSQGDRLENNVGNALAVVFGGLLFLVGAVGAVRSAAGVTR